MKTILHVETSVAKIFTHPLKIPLTVPYVSFDEF